VSTSAESLFSITPLPRHGRGAPSGHAPAPAASPRSTSPPSVTSPPNTAVANMGGGAMPFVSFTQGLTLVHFSAQPAPVFKQPNVSRKNCTRRGESGRV